jgi:hypothetical protein
VGFARGSPLVLKRYAKSQIRNSLQQHPQNDAFATTVPTTSTAPTIPPFKKIMAFVLPLTSSFDDQWATILNAVYSANSSSMPNSENPSIRLPSPS